MELAVNAHGQSLVVEACQAQRRQQVVSMYLKVITKYRLMWYMSCVIVYNPYFTINITYTLYYRFLKPISSFEGP